MSGNSRFGVNWFNISKEQRQKIEEIKAKELFSYYKVVSIESSNWAFIKSYCYIWMAALRDDNMEKYKCMLPHTTGLKRWSLLSFFLLKYQAIYLEWRILCYRSISFINRS
jgi:hypothetical protein